MCFSMVSEIGWGFIESSKNTKILKNERYGTYFTGLQGFIGGFVVGVCLIIGPRLRICGLDIRLRWYLSGGGGFGDFCESGEEVKILILKICKGVCCVKEWWFGQLFDIMCVLKIAIRELFLKIKIELFLFRAPSFNITQNFFLSSSLSEGQMNFLRSK